MSAKLVVTLLATSLLTVGCVAYTDDPYYRGGYGYHDHDDDRYDGRRYSDWERKRWEERKRIYEQQRKDAREQEKKSDHEHRNYRHDD